MKKTLNPVTLIGRKNKNFRPTKCFGGEKFLSGQLKPQLAYSPIFAHREIRWRFRRGAATAENNRVETRPMMKTASSRD
jgi:hypothetical protein